jgi:hypothetical protein
MNPDENSKSNYLALISTLQQQNVSTVQIREIAKLTAKGYERYLGKDYSAPTKNGKKVGSVPHATFKRLYDAVYGLTIPSN